MSEHIKTVALFYKEGTSDKEYQITITDNKDGTFAVNGWNGRRGSALKKQEKGSYDLDGANKIFNDILKKQLKKGYTEDTSGAVYSSIQGEREFSGFVPQLLNTIRDEEKLSQYLNNDTHYMQMKYDGERRPIMVNNGDIKATNKEGLYTNLPQNIINNILSIKKDFLIDGEQIGDNYYAFDILELDGKDLRNETYSNRFEKLNKLLAKKDIEIVKTAITAEEKNKLFEQIKNDNDEGVVFKDHAAKYAPSRPASGGSQLKFKFNEICSVLVERVNKKRSVGVVCLSDDGEEKIDLGDITIPSNFDVPKVGSIVNVRYLYKYPNGSLFQTTYMGERNDQVLPDKLSQFKHKNEPNSSKKLKI